MPHAWHHKGFRPFHKDPSNPPTCARYTKARASEIVPRVLHGPHACLHSARTEKHESQGREYMDRVARRIVTGHNAQGKSIFVADGPCPYFFDRGNGNALTEIWWEADMPVDNSGNEDCGRPDFGLDMPPNGHIFRIVE